MFTYPNFPMIPMRERGEEGRFYTNRVWDSTEHSKRTWYTYPSGLHPTHHLIFYSERQILSIYAVRTHIPRANSLDGRNNMCTEYKYIWGKRTTFKTRVNFIILRYTKQKIFCQFLTSSLLSFSLSRFYIICTIKNNHSCKR